MSLTTKIDPYQTRVVSEPVFLPRLDPVVHGDEQGRRTGPLTGEQVEAFERDGYLFFRDLFSPLEIESWVAELHALRDSEAIKRREETITEPATDDVRSIFRIHQLSEVFSRLSANPGVADVARQLMGSDVYLHQSRLNYKPGFAGKEFYWHSDFETWHAEDGMPRMRCVSASILLTENNEFNGPLMVMPGSHKYFISCVGETPDDHYKQSLKKQEVGVPDTASLQRLSQECGIVAPKGPAGSVLFFECNLIHGSSSNISPFPRSNVFFVYNSVENTLVEPYYARKPRPDFIASRTFRPVPRG